MEVKELYSELVKAYRPENLNTLSSSLITLYKQKDVATLRRIHAMIYDGDQGAELTLSRLFSKVIVKYHPDRQQQIESELKEFLARENFEGLQTYRHILEVQHVQVDVSGPQPSTEESWGYGDLWDDAMDMNGYSYIDEEPREYSSFDPVHEAIMKHGFMAAVKRKVYGHLNVDFPAHLLADMEIIEMAEYEIEELEGVEYCTYARIMDLSANNLTDISALGQLLRLEEIYLQNNNVSDIDHLTALPYLRILDLSHNDLSDISALFEIDTLEFVNLVGNRVPEWQLELLRKQGVVLVV